MGMVHSGWKVFGIGIMLAGLLCVCGSAHAATAAGVQNLDRKLKPLIGESDAVMVCAPDGNILSAIHADRPMVPASILKVLTALAALHYLGEEYRFPTDFYTRPGGDLIIKGYGDPLLVSERLEQIARHLAKSVAGTPSLILDDTYFAYPIVIPGRSHSTEPYDAPNGALCVNFNTVFFARRNGQWVSAEPQTPLLSCVTPIIEASGLSSGRITLGSNRKENVKYSGELLNYFLRQAGVATSGEISIGRADPENDKLLWRHRSDKLLTDVISELLAFSNNFIANQLLLAMGAQAFRPPADMDKGLEALRTYYGSVLGQQTGFLAEGSGISRRNRISARTMMLLLDRFASYHTLMRHDGRQFYKTGTLSDVRSRAGYLEAAGGGFYRFVVMINTPGKTTDRVMQVIERELM